jgi:hypothetical protein
MTDVAWALINAIPKVISFFLVPVMLSHHQASQLCEMLFSYSFLAAWWPKRKRRGFYISGQLLLPKI